MRNYHALAMHSLRVQDWLQISKGVLMSFLDSWAYFFVVAGWDEGHKHHIFSNISLDQEPRKQGCKGGSSTPWYFYGVERGGGGWFSLQFPQGCLTGELPSLTLTPQRIPSLHNMVFLSFEWQLLLFEASEKMQVGEFHHYENSRNRERNNLCVCVCVLYHISSSLRFPKRCIDLLFFLKGSWCTN